jgi:hypothetical protein
MIKNPLSAKLVAKVCNRSPIYDDFSPKMPNVVGILATKKLFVKVGVSVFNIKFAEFTQKVLHMGEAGCF